MEIGAALDVPILVLSGGEDLAVPANEVRTFFDALAPGVDRYYVNLPKAKHTSFQDECQEACELPQERAHDLVNRYVTAFLQTYVAGDERYARFLERGVPPDAELTRGEP
jgi:predicted dienelactone hydrolase